MTKENCKLTGSANKLYKNGWTSLSVSGPPRFRSSTPIFSSAVCSEDAMKLTGYVHSPTEENILPAESLCFREEDRDGTPRTSLFWLLDPKDWIRDASWDTKWTSFPPFESLKEHFVTLLRGHKLQMQANKLQKSMPSQNRGGIRNTQCTNHFE